MNLNLISIPFVFILAHSAFSNPLGHGSFTPDSKEIDGVRIISELEKNESIYKSYKKDKIAHFSVRRKNSKEDLKLCFFPSGRGPSFGNNNNYRIVDVLESDHKITFLLATYDAYSVFTLTDVQHIPKNHFIFGASGMINDNWFVSNMVHATTFKPILGSWNHAEHYEYANLISHQEFRIKVKNKDKEDVYKILFDEIQKNDVKAENTGSPRLNLINNSDFVMLHKLLVLENKISGKELVEQLKFIDGGKDRLFEILVNMDDQTKAREVKASIKATLKNNQ